MEEEEFLTKIRLHKILDILITDGKIKTYSSSNFYPKMKVSSHIYNTWTGFEVDKGKPVFYLKTKVKPLLDFILTQICNGNVENYNYLLSWIYIRFCIHISPLLGFSIYLFYRLDKC